MIDKIYTIHYKDVNLFCKNELEQLCISFVENQFNKPWNPIPVIELDVLLILDSDEFK